MNRSQARPSAVNASHKITRETVKLCALCETLNHQDNVECWTCRWHGGFSLDESMVALAWQRLESQYEQVRLEHVTSQNMRLLGDFGRPRPRSSWQRLADACREWWRTFQTQRDLTQAQRQTRLRSRIPSRPDQLGV